MLGALAAAALIAAGSLVVGHATLRICGHPGSWLAGPLGLALLLALSGLLASIGARAPALAVAFLALAGISGAYLALTANRGRDPGSRAFALLAAALAALFAALPFIAANQVGILGVGLVNDDMASHLLIADWIDERFRPEPVFIDQGYPLGPHALVAGLFSLLSASSIDVFAGLVLALPMLTALVAFGALTGLRPLPRALCAALVALPYMAAAYLAQEAFKEPILALFLLAFALLLPRVRSPREAIPLGLLAAGIVYVYSFPGLAWPLLTLLIWGAVELWRSRRQSPGAPRPLSATLRLPLLASAAALLAFVVVVAPELHRLIEFTDFRALDPDKANEGGLGNLREQLSPLSAFGIWPTSEFRLPAGAGSLPAVAFYAAGLLAAFAFLVALPRWLRRHGPAIPAAILAAALLYLGARAFGTVYTSAKALALAAPLIALVTLGGLLAEGTSGKVGGSADASPGDRLRTLPGALAAVVAAAMAFSSFLVLRQAPVAPETHMDELAQIRPLVEGEKLLFLGRDNFILYELRGSKPFTAVKNYYDPFYVKPNTELADVFSKFDFDSVEAKTLARFPYVLTTRAAYASGPPPGYVAIAQTPTYVLWEARGGVGDRSPAERDAAPGAVGACEAPADRRGDTAAAFTAEPIVVPARSWSTNTLEDGSFATVEVAIPKGEWALSLQYDATRPLTLSEPRDLSSSGGEFSHTLPANLDYRGPAPFYPAGEISGGRRFVLSASVESPPFPGELLGARSTAHLGALALTPITAAGGYIDGAERPYPGDAATLVGGAEACARYADWFAGPPKAR